MVTQTSDSRCPISTPWCSEHDSDEKFCLHRVNEFVLTSTDGYRFAESESEDAPVAVSVRKYGLVGVNRWPDFVEIDLPETTDTGVHHLTAAEARSLGNSLIDAARILEPGCTVLWCAGGCRWDDADPAAPRLHSRTWPSGVKICQIEYRHPEVDGRVFAQPVIALLPNAAVSTEDYPDLDTWREFRSDLDEALWRADMATQHQPSGVITNRPVDALELSR